MSVRKQLLGTIGIAWLIAPPAFAADPSVPPLPAYVRGSDGYVTTAPSYPSYPEHQLKDLWSSPPTPSKSAVKAPAARVVPRWSWTGFYLGAHLGGGAGTASFSDPFGSSIYGDIVRTPAFLGGGQIGFNWQVPNSPYVLGAQADIGGLASQGTNTCFAYSGSAINATCRVSPEATSTVTGRFGYVVGPEGRTLVYAKGGVAWADSQVDMALNPFEQKNITSNSSNLQMWGGTVGAGAEYALTPAWSLFAEYGFLDFGTDNVTNLGNKTVSPLGHVTQVEAPSSSGVTQNFQEFKLGLNYKLGADPWAVGLDAPPGPPYPVGPWYQWSPIPGVGPGWELEMGLRYMYSWGLFHKDLGQPVSSGSPTISSISRLTYDDMQTNSGELFARFDTPWNFFVKGFAGGGVTGNGHMNDEDFGISFYSPPAPPYVPYSNTVSSVTGNTVYGLIDAGYDFLHGMTYKAGGFVGYTVFHQIMNAYGCNQIANANSDCVGAFVFPANFRGITETDTWQALRIGMSGEAMLTDKIKISVDAAYLPWVNFSGVDNHLARGIIFPETSNAGQGVQLEGILSYYLTPSFSVGVGGRYWAAWTTSGSDYDATYGTTPTYFRATFEQAGAFLQASYKFGVPGWVAARSTQ